MMWADQQVRAPDGGKLTSFPPLVRQAAPAFLTSPDGAAEGDLLLVQRGREAPRGGAAEFVHGFFLSVAVTRAILTHRFAGVV